ncbi:MAG: GspH/FimT family pseudopilin [Burkholderiales bacterium]|nr:GspH/FimT family pseudopilin [Burkholderiales bacterium]
MESLIRQPDPLERTRCQMAPASSSSERQPGGPGMAGQRISASSSQRGFTLIELLVVLIVAAVITGMVTLSGSPSPDRVLRQDAERLALLLSLAREEAQVRGAPIRFESDSSGYRFVIFRDRQWRTVADDGDLRPRPWGTETRLLIERADGTSALEFGRDMVEAPYRVRMQRPGASVTIVANGLGSFDVVD